MLDLQEAGVISTSLEAILYGFSIFMFTLTMWIMLRSRRRRQYNSGMILAACSLFVLSTAEMAVNISRVYQGFITLGPRLHGGPAQYFDNVSELTFVVKSCLYNAQTLILDGAVIYRTYVVWQSWLIVIFPMLGWCGLLATSIGVNYALATASTHAGNIFAAQTGRWITSLYALTLTTNLSSTCLLAFRIWQVARHSSQYATGGRLMSVLRVVIESGAIYSVTITAALATFVSQSNSVYIILDMISPIITIVFNMIIVRIGIASSRTLAGGTTAQTTADATRWAVAPGGRSDITGGRGRNGGTYELKDVISVEISQFMCRDGDESASDPEVSGTIRTRDGVKSRVDELETV